MQTTPSDAAIILDIRPARSSEKGSFLNGVIMSTSTTAESEFNPELTVLDKKQSLKVRNSETNIDLKVTVVENKIHVYFRYKDIWIVFIL